MTSTVRTTPQVAPQQRISVILICVLALLSAIAPFATDLYLAAFPVMITDLNTTASGIQLSLTTFLIGAGLGQLIFGPLSDRLGRRGPLLVGLVIYLISSIAAALAPTITVLVIARLVQGLSGAAGMVLSRAVISDLARGVAAARAMSVMMLVSSIAPIAAVFLGGLLVDSVGWRGLLGIVAVLGAISIPLVLIWVKETRPASARTRADAHSDAGGGRLLSRRYLGYTLTYAFSFATLMAYISGSSYLYQSMMGFTSVQYGLFFGLNALVLAVGGALSARLVGRFSPTRLIGVGLVIKLLSVVVFAAIALSSLAPIWLALPLMSAMGSLGLILGNTTALALDAVPDRAGSASAWLGCLQFLLAGIVSPIVGIGGEYTAVPLAWTMLATTVVALTAFLMARRAPAAQPAITTAHAASAGGV